MRKLSLLTTCIVFAASTVVGEADEANPESKPWHERIQIGGDLRFRYEGFRKVGEFDDGRRDRLRFRLRVGLEIFVTDSIRAGIQVRSGNPRNPVSDNQTFGEGFSKKDINLAQVYADFKLSDNASVIVGKFDPRRWWEVSDMQWDSDVVVEGAMERFRFEGAGATFKRLEASAYQFTLEESGSGSEAWVFGAQVRPTFKLGGSNELTIGAGFDDFVQPQQLVDLTLDGVLLGNRMTNLLDQSNELVSNFRVMNTFLLWRNRLSKRWPLTLSLFGYKNAGTADHLGNEIGTTDAQLIAADNDIAIFGRVEVGIYEKLGQLAARYSRYDSEPDAIFYAFMQSDTSRASNVKGSRVDVRIGMPARGYINITWYRTKPNKGNDNTLDRWQFDYIMRF